MATLTLTPEKETSTGLGCLNGLACPNCKAPMVDTLSGITLAKNEKECYCPMCEYTAKYNILNIPNSLKLN